MLDIVTAFNTLFRLSFYSENLEKKYQKDYLQNSIGQNIAAAKIAIAIYIIYAPITYFLIHDEAKLLFYIVMFAVSGPVFFLSIYKSKIFLQRQQFILYVVALIAGLGPVLFYLFTVNDRAIFQVDLLIPIIAIFTMYGVGFVLALSVALSLLTLFVLFSILLNIPTLDILMAIYTMLIGGVVVAIAAYLTEKSNRQLFLAKLENSDFKDIMDSALDFVAIYDQKTFKYLYANEAVLKINNFTLEEIQQKTFLDVHPEIEMNRAQEIIKELRTNSKTSKVMELHDYNNETYYAHMILQTGVFNTKEVFINISSDITELKKAELKIKEMYQRDQLTQLYNRYKLDEVMQQQRVNFKRYKQVFSFIICDIDYFKKVNDTYGHSVGDQVLVKIANVISNSTRESDIVARWGGEEFAILLPNTSGSEAFNVAQKLHNEVAKTLHEGVGNVYISCGVSEYRKNDTQNTLFIRVDNALYEAKKNGRNQIVYK